MKQETLEEAAARHSYGLTNHNFIKGAKWQQERSYSEEEVFSLLMDFWKEEKPEFKVNPVCVSNWFEKFKKK